MSNVANAILKVKLEGIIHEILVHTRGENVDMGGGRNLVQFLTDYLTAQEVDARFAALVGTAPEALDTLGEIADRLKEDSDAVAAIQDILQGKVRTTDFNAAISQLQTAIADRAAANHNHDERYSQLNHTHAPDANKADRNLGNVTDADFRAKGVAAGLGGVRAGTSVPANLSENELFLQITD